MRNILFPLFVLFIFAVPVTGHAKDVVKSKEPKLIGVLYYADWCGTCKILDPQIEKARGKMDLDNMPIVFVRMDLTNKTTAAQSGMLASALGLGALYNDNSGKTGYMALVDSETKGVVATIDKTMKADDISALITEKL